MPQFHRTTTTINDVSNLNPGDHPAFLMAILDEETPETWTMYQQSPRMWRWHFAVYSSDAALGQEVPELQSTVSSQKFSPPVKNYSASKAYRFVKAILNRDIPRAETVDLDPMMPIPCRVIVSRKDSQGEAIEFANIDDVNHWASGPVTPAFAQYLRQWYAEKTRQTPPPQAPPAPQAFAPAPAPAPAQQPLPGAVPAPSLIPF